MNFSKLKSIFILLLIITITTFIGEFKRIEKLKEGNALDDLGNLFSGIVNIFKMLGSVFSIVGDIFSRVGDIFVLIFTKIPNFLAKVLIWAFIDIPFWLIQYITCAWKKLLAFKDCFLWYSLEIIGKLIYLPFRITFYVLDLILESTGIDDIRIQPIIDKLWWFIDDIDHFQYPLSGVHIVHYPDEIIEKCYSCKVSNFPAFPRW
jgi:hypothetical protein